MRRLAPVLALLLLTGCAARPGPGPQPATTPPPVPAPTPPPVAAPTIRDGNFTAFFLDRQRGWAAGSVITDNSGSITIARTTDGGVTWQRTALTVLRWQNELRLRFTDAEHGWLLATSGPALGTMWKSVFLTADGGESWRLISSTDGPGATATPQPLPGTEYVTGLGARDDSDLWVSDLYRSENKLPLYHSADGGAHWQAASGSAPAAPARAAGVTGTVTGRVGGAFAGYDLNLQATADGRLFGRFGGVIQGNSLDAAVQGVPPLLATAIAAAVYLQRLQERHAASGSSGSH